MIQDLLLKAQGDFPKFLSSVQKEGKGNRHDAKMQVIQELILAALCSMGCLGWSNGLLWVVQHL